MVPNHCQGVIQVINRLKINYWMSYPVVAPVAGVAVPPPLVVVAAVLLAPDVDGVLPLLLSVCDLVLQIVAVFLALDCTHSRLNNLGHGGG